MGEIQFVVAGQPVSILVTSVLGIKDKSLELWYFLLV